ncbi:unnamed protein product [Blepharisma stoltei]|uniref:Uncharacterized protein n=1 Tax=Blepharisma stoltei TaxID=1481888 RepID=A0AAU9IHL4_9CILI|nr:unnamed protein product [Blepharisma stoltei]
MNKELDSVLQEAVIHSIDYSPLRRSNQKWEAGPLTINAVLEKLRIPRRCDIQIIRDSQARSALQIHRNRGEVVFILLPEFLNRTNIKRNHEVFSSLYGLWTAINPNHVKLVPKSLYKKLNEEISRIFYSNVNPYHIAQDIEIDFGNSKGIVFSQFYDSMFELIDNKITSKDLQDYIDLIYRVQQIAYNSPWVKNERPDFNVIRDNRPSYHSWMLPFFTHKRTNSLFSVS